MMRTSTGREILFRLTVLVSSIFLMTSTAHAEHSEPVNYVLGDSLSDVGALGMTYTNAEQVSVSPQQWIFGKVWVQDIPEYTSKSTFCRDQVCKGSSDTTAPFYYTRHGNNYAVGGAGVLFSSSDLGLINLANTDLPSQVSALIHNAGYTPSSNKQDRIFEIGRASCRERVCVPV